MKLDMDMAPNYVSMATNRLKYVSQTESFGNCKNIPIVSYQYLPLRTVCLSVRLYVCTAVL